MNFIYVDEVGYSISVQGNRGRSKIGKPVTQKLPLSQTPNSSVCTGIWGDEIILYEICRFFSPFPQKTHSNNS